MVNSVSIGKSPVAQIGAESFELMTHGLFR